MSLSDNAERLTLHVLHTNDFHSGLTDIGVQRLRDAVAALNGAPHLLLDAGDAIKAGNVGVNPFGEPILETMSVLGYQAMTMGNREFHVWHNILETKINRARFPILCANIRPNKEGVSLPVQPNVTLAAGGLRIAVFGVTVPMVTERMAAKAVSSFVFDDPVEVARQQVAHLRYGADILIAMTHIGIRDDRRLCESVSGIDLLIGGHTHLVFSEPEVVNGVPMLQAGSHAHYYGHAVLSVGREGARLDAYSLHVLEEKRK